MKQFQDKKYIPRALASKRSFSVKDGGGPESLINLNVL